MINFLKKRLLSLRRDAVMLVFAVRDPRTPFKLKLAALGAAGYLITPIDLIPITIPVAGLIDDLIIVPAIVGAVARRLPDGVHEDAGMKADQWIGRHFQHPVRLILIVLAILIVVWIALLALAIWLLALVFGRLF